MSPDVYATLTPANPPAKLAFDKVAACMQRESQPARKRYIHVNPTREFDREVSLYSNRGGYSSDTSTELATDAEDEESGLIWTGYYTFDLTVKPRDPARGWRAGKNDSKTETEFLLTIEKDQPDVRTRHANFNLDPGTGMLRVVSRASKSGAFPLDINGEGVSAGMNHLLNQTGMTIQFGSLKYTFDYTEFARSERCADQRRRYAAEVHLVEIQNYHLTPTPIAGSRVTGIWTTSRPLNKGAFGKVYSATNRKGQLVAIKTVDRHRKNQAEVKREIDNLSELTKLAQQEGEDRIIQMLDVRYSNGKENFSTGRLDEVDMILSPCAEGTFDELISKNSSFQGMSSRQMHLLRDALEGLQFLHSHGWMHRDLKPANLGFIGARAVILDLGGAIQKPEGKIPATPGCVGTLWYLAPEMEMQGYDNLVDIWAMGIIFFELVHGSHPWPSPENPWRPDKPELRHNLRRQFHAKYSRAIENTKLRLGKKEASASDLLLKMLRHPWSQRNSGNRPDIEEVLRHPCWREAGDNEPPRKTARIQGESS